MDVWLNRLEAWTGRFAEAVSVARARLGARRAPLATAVVLTLGYAAVAKLSLLPAAVLLAAFVAWCVLWPIEVGGGRSQRGADARAQEQALWQRTIDGFPEPALALAASGRVVHVNAAGRDLLGADRTGIHYTLISRDPGLLRAIDQTMTDGTMRAVELQERVPLARRRLATVAPIAGTNGAPAAPTLLITLRDLTEQDRLARMRADFVANASHELRTPLASLKGFVETLQGAAKDDPAARERFLAVMNEQAERMTRLIDDLLSLSRVEMREHLPPSAQVDIGEVLGHVVQFLQPLADRVGATLRVTSEVASPMVRGDRDELVQVFQNLIQNAIKYGRPNGTVDVRLVAQGGRYVISVQDNGPGIAPEHLPRLTERFYRVNVAASRERGGTGLGLAIVKHILNRHRGELTITSELGKGSTFSVTLPARSA